MPNWVLEILMVWSIRPRSLYLIMIGLSAWLLLPVMADWYWSGVHLEGQFHALEDVLGEKYIRRAGKAGFWIMIGCFLTAFKAYSRDRKKL